MKYLFVGLGAALGGMLRFYIFDKVSSVYSNYKFPISTFVVNILGSILIGIFIGLSKKYSQELKLFLTVGFCGGFTTFSAFSVEVLNLVKQGDYFLAFAYSLVSLVLCVFGAYLGMKIF